MDDKIYNSINNSINSSEQEIITIQNSTIKKLNEQLSIYKSQIKEQREKIFSCDNLVINFNSLNNTYIKLKKDNEILIQKLSEKNKIINEYQILFFESKCKIVLTNQLNDILKEKINFIQTAIPQSENSEFIQKLNFFDEKIQKIKEECCKKEEEFKNKIFDKNVYNNNDKLNESERKISELKFELSLTKKINEDYAKEKEEINKKSNDIFKEKNKVNKEINEYKNKNKKLKEENEYLTEYFNNKGKEFQNILLNIRQSNNINMKELTQKDVIINNLMKDKENLYKEIENLNSKIILVKNIYNKKYQKLKDLVDSIEKEKKEGENKINEKYKDEINKLKDEINKYKNKVEDNIKNEDKYIKEIEELKSIIQDLQIEKNRNINKNNKTCFHDYENQLYYTCNYCNCKHILCKECQENYQNNK